MKCNCLENTASFMKCHWTANVTLSNHQVSSLWAERSFFILLLEHSKCPTVFEHLLLPSVPCTSQHIYPSTGWFSRCPRHHISSHSLKNSFLPPATIPLVCWVISWIPGHIHFSLLSAFSMILDGIGKDGRHSSKKPGKEGVSGEWKFPQNTKHAGI